MSGFVEPSLDELIRIVQNESMICFGRSMSFLSFSYMMNSFRLADRILCVVDNDETVWGTSIPGFDCEWEVRSPESIKKYYESAIVIITVGRRKNASRIAEQIKTEYGVDKNRIIYSSTAYDEWIRRNIENVNIPDNIRVTEKPVIPKIIHYCWFGDKDIPDNYIRWMSTWKEMCPDYEIVRWDENNYDISKNEYMRKAYEAGNYGFVTDYARLDIIYKIGGIYFDTDVEILKPLDEMLYQYGFTGYLPDERIATGLGIGAVKGLDIIRKLLEDYDHREFKRTIDRKERVSTQLCSEIQTEYLLRNPNWRFTNSIVDMDGLRVYPSPVFDGLNADEETRNRLSYSIHHYAGSWLQEG